VLEVKTKCLADVDDVSGLPRSGVCAQILEFNFIPDCERACRYYPDFTDSLFEAMFLSEHKWSVHLAIEQFYPL
jgi:hypothetical protein